MANYRYEQKRRRGFLMFVVLSCLLVFVGGCDVTKGRYDKAQVPTVGGTETTISGTVATKAEEAAEILPMAEIPDLTMVVARCEPKNEDAQEAHEPLIRNIPLSEYQAYIQSLASGTQAEVIASTVVIVKRTITLEVKGSLREVPLSYVVPMQLFLLLAPTGDTSSVANLLYQIGLPMPSELFLYFLEQSMIPQSEDPDVYLKNKKILLGYFKFSEQLQTHLLQEQKSVEDLTAALTSQGLSADNIQLVLKHYAGDPVIENEHLLYVMFISPDQCRYHTPMEGWLPTFGLLVNQPWGGVEPGEIIDQLWGTLKVNLRVGGRWLICPSPTDVIMADPPPYIYVPGGKDDDGTGKEPCDPKKVGVE